MSLTLLWNGLDKPEGNAKEVGEQQDLKKYLLYSMGRINGKEDEEPRFVTFAFADKISRETIDKTSKKVEQEMRGFDLRTKLNARLSADKLSGHIHKVANESGKKTAQTARLVAETLSVAVPSVVAGLAVSVVNDTAGKIVAGVVAAKQLMKVAVRRMVTSQTAEEALSVEKYRELKQIQFGLKKLKQAIVSDIKPTQQKTAAKASALLTVKAVRGR